MMGMMLVLMSPDGESTLPAPFRVNPGLLIWAWVVFIPLLILLSKTAFPLIVKSVAEREERLKKLSAEAQDARDQATALLEEHRAMLASATGEASAIIAEARQAAERERAMGIEKTRVEQDEMLTRARREIEAEKLRAVADVRREAVDIAIAAASKVVGQRLDAATDRQLVEDYIASIGAST